jgi:membrane-associated protease RseP (regulator of RpoE activity)
MGSVKTFDPRKVKVLVNGVPVTGFADGTFLSIASNGEQATRSVGADGEVSRAITADYTSTVVVTLKQTSQSNDMLMAYSKLDQLSGSGLFSLAITDLGGTTLFFWDSAFIQQVPDAEFGKEISERAWTILTGQPVQSFVGGNL